MVKKKDQKLLLAIAVIVILFLVKGNTPTFSFYENRECFVSDRMAGCEGSGTTYIVDYLRSPSWKGYLTCTAWLKAHDCIPQNCNYLEGAHCDGYGIEDMESLECDNDEDCWNNLGHTGYLCYADMCEFTTNHNGMGERIETNETDGDGVSFTSPININEWMEQNKRLLALIIIISGLWFLTFVFQEPQLAAVGKRR